MTTERERRAEAANTMNLAGVARELLSRALTVNGIIAGPHSITITGAGNLALELTREEARHLATILEEGSR